LLPISATEVRKKVKAGKSIRYLVPDAVREEIERNGYYR
jgi:nicotinate-nucleotide adenylyltransferase